jgi:hypothetical protein
MRLFPPAERHFTVTTISITADSVALYSIFLRSQLPFSFVHSGVLPIFPLEVSITVKGYSVRRKQIPICPAFCLTGYKIQGATIDSVILDLKDDIKNRRQGSHRKYCSTYVQLSRLRSLNGLHLLQSISMCDLDHRPDPQLLEEMRSLQALQQQTLGAADKFLKRNDHISNHIFPRLTCILYE